MSCICEFCEDGEGVDWLDYKCEFCFAYCPDLSKVGQDAHEAEISLNRFAFTMIRWSLHRMKHHLEDRCLDPVEWVRRIFAGEAVPTVLELCFNDDYDARMFKLRCMED